MPLQDDQPGVQAGKARIAKDRPLAALDVHLEQIAAARQVEYVDDVDVDPAVDVLALVIDEVTQLARAESPRL